MEVLRDLLITVPLSHTAAAKAFWDKIAAAETFDKPALRQKVLLARLAAESISATEDLGGLAWSIANRHKRGIVNAYLAYSPGNVRDIFSRVERGDSLPEVLRLPTLEQVRAAAPSTDYK